MQRESDSLRKLLPVLLLALVASCGGGGSGGSDPAPSNSQSASGATAATFGSVTAPVSGLASNGARAVPTYESLGLYWTPPSPPSADGCVVIFRRVGDSTFQQGLNLW